MPERVKATCPRCTSPTWYVTGTVTVCGGIEWPDSWHEPRLPDETQALIDAAVAWAAQTGCTPLTESLNLDDRLIGAVVDYLHATEAASAPAR
jgi:hypothetical protein